MEIVSINNNSVVTPQPNQQQTTICENESTNPTNIMTSSNHQPSTVQLQQPVKTDKSGTKNNFFKSLRSSFSFSSLRVKKTQQRPSINISSPLEASDHYQVLSMNDFLFILAQICLHVSQLPLWDATPCALFRTYFDRHKQLQSTMIHDNNLSILKILTERLKFNYL